MPLVPRLAIAMLACARIGATQTQLFFGGFSRTRSAISQQWRDNKSADGGYRRGSRLGRRLLTKPVNKRRRNENVIVFPARNSKINMHYRF